MVSDSFATTIKPTHMANNPKNKIDKKTKEMLIASLTAQMLDASKHLEFERAAYLRDRIKDLKTTK